jgi:hypothetical protein
MRLLEVTETLEGFRCGVKMRADRRNACDSRARLDPQRPALDVKVRTRCGRKTLLSRDRVALLLSVARSKAARWPLAAFVPESIEMEDLWADCRLRALSTTLLGVGYTGPSTATARAYVQQLLT